MTWPPNADGKLGAIVQAANAEGPPGGAGFSPMKIGDGGLTSAEAGNWPLSVCGGLEAGPPRCVIGSGGGVTWPLPRPPVTMPPSGKKLVLSQSWLGKISAVVVDLKFPIPNGCR